MVELRDIGFGAGGRDILDQVSIRFEPGTLSVLLGPNGAGKSTLLRIAAGLLPAGRGVVSYADQPIRTWDTVKLARIRAVLSQHAQPAFPLSAREVVEMGRYPHFQRIPSRTDQMAVERALERVEMSGFRDRAFATLSAGEQQKVHMARVLAQLDAGGHEGGSGRVLFLDEPTSNLDVHHQLQILTIARGLLAQKVTVIAVLHDLNLACDFADHLVLMSRGRLAHSGLASDGLPGPLLESVYGVRARRLRDTEDGSLVWRFHL